MLYDMIAVFALHQSESDSLHLAEPVEEEEIMFEGRAISEERDVSPKFNRFDLSDIIVHLHCKKAIHLFGQHHIPNLNLYLH